MMHLAIVREPEIVGRRAAIWIEWSALPGTTGGFVDAFGARKIAKAFEQLADEVDSIEHTNPNHTLLDRLWNSDEEASVPVPEASK